MSILYIMPTTINRMILNIKTWILSGIVGAVIALSYLFILLPFFSTNGLGKVIVYIYLWLLFCFLIYIIFTRMIIPRLKGFSFRWKLWWFICALISGIWLAINIPLRYPSLPANIAPVSILNKIIFLGSSGITIGILLFVFSVYIVTWNTSKNFNGNNRRYSWLMFALPMLVVWGIYLLTFWPGMMSADSMDQWGQMLTGQYNDHHPAFHTFIIWLLTRIYPSPVAVALTQIVTLAFLCGFIFCYFQTIGVPSWTLWITSFIFALTPVNGTMVNTLWKDIPYSTAFLGLTFILFQIAKSRGKWLSAHGSWVKLGIVSLFVAILRHSGLPIVIGTFIVLFVAVPKHWRQIVFAVLVCGSLYWGIRGPLYKIVNVKSSMDLQQSTTSLYTIAANASPGTETAEVLKTMNPLSPLWNCTSITKLYAANSKSIHIGKISIGQKAFNLAERIPSILEYYFRCRRSLVWIIWDPFGLVLNTSHVEVLDDPNSFGITPDSKIPFLGSIISSFVVNSSRDTNINWFVWRPAIFLYIFLFTVFIQTLRTKDLRYLIVTIPILLQSIESTIIFIAPNFRYHYAVYLIALIFIPVLFLPMPINSSLDSTQFGAYNDKQISI